MIPIGVQLYSLRDERAQDLIRFLERIRAMGYAGVEPAGYFGHPAATFRRGCESVGLSIPAVHAGLPRKQGGRRWELDGTEIDAVCEEIASLGSGAWIVPEISAEEYSCAGLARIADALAFCAERAGRAGLALGYHNHEWEFALAGPVADPGCGESRSLHRSLFDSLPDSVFAEVDVYWAQVGGAQPALELERLGARARMLHLKDGPASDDQAPMTALGDGALDLASVLAASRAEWHFVEIDRCDGDIWAALAKSAAYLASPRSG